MISNIDIIWQYSHFYGELVQMSERLNNDGEGYAAFLVLFNLTESLCKSLRESYSHNLNEDLQWMLENDILTPEEFTFLSDSDGLRKIRNTMTHKDAYQYCFEEQYSGTIYPFSDLETWTIIYNKFAPQIIQILCNAIRRK